jgi:hypothetical protein
MQFQFKDPAHKRLGYWVAGGGVALTLLMGLAAIAAPQIRASIYWKVPPCSIFAGLILEAIESAHQRTRRRG